MSALKSVLSVVVGIVSVAGMMAIALLCPLAFIKLVPVSNSLAASL